MTKLKNSFVYKTLLNNYFLVAFLILLTLISITNYFCVIFLIIFLYYLYKKEKTIFIFGIIFSVSVIVHFIYLDLTYEYETLSEVEGQIIDISPSNDGYKYIIKNGYKKHIVYDYENDALCYGDIVIVQGKALNAEENRIRNGFNYKEYLKNTRIFSSMLAKTVKVEGNRFHIGVLKHYFKKYLENTFSKESSTFLKAMIISDLNDVDDDFNEAIMNNGILHLFAVSGLHIVLFIGLLERVLKFFNLQQNKIGLINSVFLILYLIITSFSPSVLRASMMYYISLINKKFKFGLTTLDIVSIIFIILIIFNPLYYYNLGFNLSFISSTIIILIGDFFKGYNKYIQVLLISIFANIITFPLVININGKINLLSPASNVLFIELVEVIILPLSFFILVFPIFKVFYEYLIIGFNKFTILFSKYFIINLRFPFLNNIGIVLYFLALFILIRVYKFKKIRYAFSLGIIFVLFIFSNSTYIFKKTEIHFLDLNNGEASLIIDGVNECYALIDTGDGKNNEVTSYLKKEGIKRLDYLIITHNHADHNGEMDYLLKEIKVNNLVISAYDNSVTNSFLNRERFANILRVKAGDEIKCGKNTFRVLHPDMNYNNTNDVSIVIHTKIGGLYFLFLGDVTQSIEDKFADLNLYVDVIKVGHHGSKTSTSAFLIESIRPKYAIIMAGRVEKFAFPHQPTIEVLDHYNVKTYRTDINYSIIYKYNKSKSIFETIK